MLTLAFTNARKGRWKGGRAGRCRRGSAGAEFGLLLPAFLVLVVGIVEVGWQLTVAATLDRATARAARFGITGAATATGAPAAVTCRSQSIPWLIKNASGRILDPARLQVTTGAYPSASGMGAAAVAGAGTGSQVVTYTVTYTEPFMTGVWLGLMGGPPHLVHRAAVVVKNEAFENAVC